MTETDVSTTRGDAIIGQCQNQVICLTSVDGINTLVVEEDWSTERTRDVIGGLPEGRPSSVSVRIR